MQLSLSRAWDETRTIFARDGGLFSAVALALVLLPQMVAGLAAPSSTGDEGMGARLIALVAAFTSIVGQLAIIRLAVGPSITVGGAIRHGFRRFPATFGAILLLVAAIALIVIPLIAILLAAGIIDMPVEGAVPSRSVATLALVLVVLSLFAAVKFVLTVPVASVEEIGPLAILKRAWALSNGNYWRLFAVEVLLMLAAVVLLIAAQMVGGTLAGIVGGAPQPFTLSALIIALFIAVAQAAFTVLASIMLARVHVQLAGAGDTSATVPRTKD